MTEQNTDRPLCPKCGAAMTPIMYGYPSSISFDRAERGEIVLGGCVITPDSPDWACRTCRTDSDDDIDIPSFMPE
ncbi:hypothetical protein OG203_42890 [Nocardia sp. NBC_01499]|uniref:hypothetical protein n=1 Tax=Nocardia sp. NBC_01499 TaxID=2903597 RepID=UPI00386D26E4